MQHTKDNRTWSIEVILQIIAKLKLIIVKIKSQYVINNIKCGCEKWETGPAMAKNCTYDGFFFSPP